MVSNARNYIESTDKEVQFCGQILYWNLTELGEKHRK